MKRLTLNFLLVVCAPLVSIAADDSEAPGFNESTFAGLEMRSIGPAMMSGRIADIAIDPNDPSTWYVGVGSGGVAAVLQLHVLQLQRDTPRNDSNAHHPDAITLQGTWPRGQHS